MLARAWKSRRRALTWTSCAARFLDAADRLDAQGAQQILGRAALLLGTRALVLDLVAPLLHEIGERWEAGSARVCHEHLASAIVRTVLGGLLVTQPPGPRARDLSWRRPGASCTSWARCWSRCWRRVAGWDVLYLGPNLPAEEIVEAALASGAAAVALSMVARADRRGGGRRECICRRARRTGFPRRWRCWRAAPARRPAAAVRGARALR